MSQTAAAIWSASALHNVSADMEAPPRAPSASAQHQPPAFLSAPFDLSDLLSPPSSSNSGPRSASPEKPYSSPADYDPHGFVSAPHHLAHDPASMDLSADSNVAQQYDFFGTGQPGGAFGARYRTGGASSSSSSLSTPYSAGTNGDGNGLYPHAQSHFADSLSSSFSSHHPHHAAHPQHPQHTGSSDSSFNVGGYGTASSGKVSPLTPADSVLGLPGGANGGFPTKNEFYGGNDLLMDRRGSFPPPGGDFQSASAHDDFGFPNGSNGPYGTHFSNNGASLHQRSSLDGLLRAGGGFDDMGPFPPHGQSHNGHHSQQLVHHQQQHLNPAADLSLRMPVEDISRMRLHQQQQPQQMSFNSMGSMNTIGSFGPMGMNVMNNHMGNMGGLNGMGGMIGVQGLSNMMVGTGASGAGGAATDLQGFIRPYLDQYVRSSNRLAFGERTVIVMSSKVAQKSYGTEKRFLCPPPTAIMIGNSWWSEVGSSGSSGSSPRRGGGNNDEPKVLPPRVVIAISGEPVPQEGAVEWTSTSGKTFDVNDPPQGTTYIGRCVGKQLFISDVDEKKKKVEALVRIVAPASGEDDGMGGGGERVIGTFPSRPIKVISKPSKKRQSAKNLELCINHGSTISLFHRLRSQTVSTKYLCVSGSGSSFKGSDGAPLMGVDQRSRTATPSFIARTASWDPFVMYIVDVNKPSGGIDAPPPPPPQPDYPSPPPNAIPFTNNGSQIPIYYNQTVVLQCLTSGVVSPVLVIRKVDHGTTVVGGGLQEGAKGVADHFCAPGEVCGDPVSQLHKIAFEVYDASRGMPEPGTPGVTGAFLSCMGEKVNTYRPVEGRMWNAPPPPPPSSVASGPTGASSRGSDSPTGAPGSPVGSTPSTLSSVPSDYFGGAQSGASSTTSAPASPTNYDFPSNDGGRVKRGKRGTSSTGGHHAHGAASPVAKSVSAKGRRRAGSAGSSAGSRHGGPGEQAASSGALWQVDIGETSVWTIVGTDQVRYNFYVPPQLFDPVTQQPVGGSSSGMNSMGMMGMGGMGGGAPLAYPVPTKPVTPFPGVVKYLPPDRAAEAPKGVCSQSRNSAGQQQQPNKPHPHAAKMLTLYGENFNKADPVTVFFGSDPSPYVEVRCTEVVGCLPPESGNMKRRPIILVRSDGVVFPSSTMYP